MRNIYVLQGRDTCFVNNGLHFTDSAQDIFAVSRIDKGINSEHVYFSLDG